MFNFTDYDGFYSLFRHLPNDIVAVIIICLGLLAVLALYRAVK